MKYCENCGAQLEDDADFCDECGAHQTSDKDNQPAENKFRKVMISICVLFAIGVMVFSIYYVNYRDKSKDQNITEATEEKQPESVKDSFQLESNNGESEDTKTPEVTEAKEPESIKDAVQWYDDEVVITALKGRKLVQYPNRQLGDVLESMFHEIEWKYGSKDNTQYLYCSYFIDNVKIELIFKDNEDNEVTLEEYYKNNEAQDKNSIKEFCDDTFTNVEESEQLEFIGVIDQIYKIEDNKYPAEITVSNQEGNWVDVNINISDGIYDITYYGMITSDSIIQISLDGGERINLMWDDETTFHAVPADGFSDDSIRMMKMLCECLNNKTYSAVQEQKSVQAVQPPDGKYWQGDTPPVYANYYVELSNVTADGFDFVIYGFQEASQDYSVVFMPHTAVYTDTYTAVYYGQQYTLTFNWQELGYLTVEGFEEWIPSESSPLYNNAYLGVS